MSNASVTSASTLPSAPTNLTNVFVGNLSIVLISTSETTLPYTLPGVAIEDVV